jgi:hypothetical protein
MFRLIFLSLLLIAAGCDRDNPAGREMRWDAASGQQPEETAEWDKLIFYPGPDPALSDGFLRINTLAYRDISDRCFYVRPYRLHFPHKFFIETRVRVVAELLDPFHPDFGAGVGFIPVPGRSVVIMMGTNGFYLNGQRHPLPVAPPVAPGETGVFRTYRIECEGDRVILYVDGVELARATAADDPFAQHTVIWWGDNSQLASATSDWEYVRHNAAE